MKILLLAPHPFYQERGTPIAVDLLIRTLSERGDEIDVLTYGEGKDVHYPRVSVRRTATFIRGVRPGFSLRKVLCDIMMAGAASRMAARKRYDIVHAVEESAFIALILKSIFRLPYVYDMDSSLPEQMEEDMPYLRHLSPLMRRMEGLAVKRSAAVVVVCQALADIAHSYDEGKKVCLLHDVVSEAEPQLDAPVDDIRADIGAEGPLLLYVGNMEPYQGIDLVLESVALAQQAMSSPTAHVVIIGGLKQDIDAYRAKSVRLGIGDTVHFLGPRPLEHLTAYLRQADILLSPRIRGNNTPMKIYAYLQSGRPVLATDIYSHRQVLDSSVAQLASPAPEAFVEAIVKLVNEPRLRERLGAAGRKYVNDNFSYRAYHEKLWELYGALEGAASTSKRAATAQERE